MVPFGGAVGSPHPYRAEAPLEEPPCMGCRRVSIISAFHSHQQQRSHLYGPAQRQSTMLSSPYAFRFLFHLHFIFFLKYIFTYMHFYFDGWW
jgi:hypothetical protein